MSVLVRFAASDEWERARELRLRALAEAPDSFGSTLEGEREATEADWRGWVTGWADSTNAMVIAEVDGVWIGMAVGSRAGADADAHLYGMWVEPGRRRDGVGASLVEAVLGWALSWGAASVILSVTEANDGAVRFYDHLGFEDTGERHPLREGSELVARILRRPL